MEPITGLVLGELFKHLKSWLANLTRAGSQRKTQSVYALRSVIIAARNTTAYIRQINTNAEQCFATEAKLSEEWTRLGFELSDLGLYKLAKRCEIKGRYWADPNQFNDSFLEKADINLVRMEQLARQMVSEIEH